MNKKPCNRFKGIIANLPTPYHEDGSLNLKALEKEIDYCVGLGVHGVACLLSSGTFTYMTESERHEVIKVVLETVAGRVPVIAGVNASTTEGTIRFAETAFEAGISGGLILPLSYWPLKAREALAHFKKIATSIDGIFGIYNNPKLTGIDLDASFYKELFSLGNVTFTKDSSGVLERVVDIKLRIKKGFDYLCGTELQLFPALRLGAEGACIAIATFLPKECVTLYELIQAGHVDQAFALHERLLPVFQFFQENSVTRGVRLLGELQGCPVGPPRLPLQGINDDEQRRELHSILLKNGLTG